jgi:hypothetical protein
MCIVSWMDLGHNLRQSLAANLVAVIGKRVIFFTHKILAHSAKLQIADRKAFHAARKLASHNASFNFFFSNGDDAAGTISGWSRSINQDSVP